METKSLKASTQAKEYEEGRNEILKELYGWNLAERIATMPISKETQAAFYFKAKVRDVTDTLYSLHDLIYGTIDNKKRSELYNAVEKLDKLADEYIVCSINENLGFRNVTEI